MENSTEPMPNVFLRYPSIAALIDTFAPGASMAERVIPPIWYLIGFVGNPMSAAIWFGKRMRRNNSSAIYLGALSISDFIFLVLHLIATLHLAWGYKTYNTKNGCEVFHFFYYVPQYLSTLLVLGFTVERYIAVVHPFLKEKWCTVRRASFLVGILTLFSVVIASAQTYIWFYYSLTDSCNIRPEAQVGGNGSFWNVWTWITDLLIFGVVPLIVLIFNVLVLREIYKLSNNGVIARQSGGTNSTTASTVTLLAVSFYLIVTQIASTILNCMQYVFTHGSIHLTDEEVREDPEWSSMFTFMTIRKIIDTICLSHYACYVFIYAFTGKHFRKEILYILTCYGRSSWLDKICSKTHRGERYSMVTGNGNPVSETCTATFTTNI
ncbi:galanin receptor type 1 [Patella vulgata]|uniref:galanin receptor type 1 n=1 Tax=Patella vulgata TaxID=6465 RepID=UPI0021808EFF|nr:galanin receptor type 1 [Patella vulgata]XP_050401707.1 galanin receptor type 1 [Patella vulgata]